MQAYFFNYKENYEELCRNIKLSKLQIDEVDFYNNKLKEFKEELFIKIEEVNFYKICLNEKDVILEINYNQMMIDDLKHKLILVEKDYFETKDRLEVQI